jgi:hypothetical protein
MPASAAQRTSLTPEDYVLMRPNSTLTVRHASATPTRVTARRAARQNSLDLSLSFRLRRGVRYTVELHPLCRTFIVLSPTEVAADAPGELADLLVSAPAAGATGTEGALAVQSVADSELPWERHARTALQQNADVVSIAASPQLQTASYGLISCGAYTSELATAVAQLSAAVATASDKYLSRGCVSSAYTLYFGAFDTSRYAAVASHYARMKSLVQGNAISPPPSCR